MAKQIDVYADWLGLEAPAQIGTLSSQLTKGKEIFSFSYDTQWLQSPHAQLLDPDLQLYSGPQYLSDDKPNFGMFLDSSPDRWGRMLMRRREAILARKDDKKELNLQESDYLLGVFDATRMGALRFKSGHNENFLADEPALASPPWVRLRELEQASLKLETSGLTPDEELKWLGMLIAPGSSLGGARPKASVSDPKGNLWIAKFPSASDNGDTGAWEMVIHQLASKAGLNVAPAELRKFSSSGHTFLTRRFDRTDGNRRIHFASAMTLMGLSDGADHHSGASYLDLAALLIQNGQRVKENLQELWMRMLFNVMVGNTDDHLRNHGFLLGEKGWELSPAYDMNPNPHGTGLTLNISDEDNSLDIDLALSVAEHFRLKQDQALQILDGLSKVVASWPQVAKQYHIPRGEQEKMASAFLMG